MLYLRTRDEDVADATAWLGGKKEGLEENFRKAERRTVRRAKTAARRIGRNGVNEDLTARTCRMVDGEREIAGRSSKESEDHHPPKCKADEQMRLARLGVYEADLGQSEFRARAPGCIT